MAILLDVRGIGGNRAEARNGSSLDTNPPFLAATGPLAGGVEAQIDVVTG